MMKEDEKETLPVVDGQNEAPVDYTDDNIRHLSDMEHVRTRPGMYIGRLATAIWPKTASMYCSRKS